MPKKLILVFAIVMFFLEYSFALAELRINEILYSPVSNQWIEIYNAGDSEIDITKYKILDSGAQVNGHGIIAAGGSNFVSSHEFVVVAKVPDNFNFTVWKSALGIKVAGDTVILRDPSGEFSDDIVSISEGSAIDGNSLQLINGSWIAAAPTPGQTNQTSSSDDNNNDDDNSSDSSSGSDSSSTSNSTETAIKTSSKIKTEITVRDIAYVGIPLAFQGRMTQDGRAMSHGRYFWNFGDGDFREVKVINIDKFTHTYYYPGEYTVIFEYYPDHFADMPDASEKINIKVIEPQISISRVGDAGDFFVELANNTSYEVDISGWLLSSNSRSFTVPKNTIIGANKKMIISGRTSGLTIYDLTGLKLLTPQNGVAFVYSPYSAPQASRTVTTVKKNASETTARAAMPDPGENLLAAANEAEVDSHLPWPVYLISVLFISASAFAVYFIRRKKTSSPGSDFEILDE